MIENKTWPFQEAARILNKINNKAPHKGYVLFETGYGPSGLPHIGTFGEVARTLMVMKAFKELSDIPVKLVVFSDDLDGLRKVPDNTPNPEMIRNYIDYPVSSIPDPFRKFNSYSEYMNNKLCEFLDNFGFMYEFKSATLCYKSGMFNDKLLVALKEFDKLKAVVLPTLGEERQASYSPFMPICAKTGKVLQVPIINCNFNDATITYNDGEEIVTSSILNGNCKLQWKADWALRWAALEVDYEMHGKDLIPSVELSTQLCKLMGGQIPITYSYELFLDENGRKISKSKGNGLAIEEWLKYSPKESLALYMYQSPHKAKRLYFDIIPKTMDEYINFASKYDENSDKKYENPCWYIDSDFKKNLDLKGINYSLLLNLASACNPENKSILWGFIKKYDNSLNAENSPFLDCLVNYAINYYNDFIKANKKYKIPSSAEIELLKLIQDKLSQIKDEATAEEIQTLFYNIGMESNFENLRDYFKNLYQIIFGQDQGPRLGSFVNLYGINETIKLIDESIKRQE